MAINSAGLGKPFSFFDPIEQDPNWKGNQVWQYDAQNGQSKDYYASWLGSQGLLGNDLNSDYARGLQNQFEQGYGAEQLNNPKETWIQYLNKYQGKIQGMMLQNTTPEQRGDSRKQFGGLGDARYLPRT